LWKEGKVCIKDLGSTNGTYLNDEEIDRRTEVPLRSGDLLKIGSGIFKFLYGGDVESLFHEEIYRITIMDGLTQTYNKRYFMEFLEREMARGLRYGRPLSLMMIDVDHFKEVNDRHGHLAGDAVLRELAHKVKGKVRREECLARFGGEEFALVTPESGPEKARKFAEKIRATVEAQKFVFDGKSVSVTVSIGIADMVPEFTEPELFIRSADERLYTAKEQGRNRVVG
jgi:diguanylate cyclase (GGDEF)-like protein